MLSAGAGGTEHVHFDVLGADLYFRVFINFRDNLQCRERGMPTSGGIKGGDTHQPVDARLAFEIAVGIFADDFDGGAFDARLISVQVIQDVILKSMAFRPVGIHTI